MKKKTRVQSLYQKLVIPLMLLVFLQAVVFIAAVGGTGILEELEYKSYQLLSFQLTNQASEIQKHFTTVAENLLLASEEVARGVEGGLASEGIALERIADSPEAVNLALELAMPPLRDYLLYNSQISGAFIMLEGSIYDGGDSRACLYIRDIAPQVHSPTYADWLLERGPSGIARQYNIPLDSKWSYEQSLSSASDNGGYYLQPIRAAQEGLGDGSLINYGYWSRPFHMQEDDVEIITYSIPLLDAQGNPYGVFGAEISTGILDSLLPGLQVADMQGFYILSGVENDSILSGWLFSDGPLAHRFLASQPRWDGDKSLRGIQSQIYQTDYSALESVVGIGAPMRLYGPSAAFADEGWHLYGFVPEHQLLASNNSTLRAIAIALGITAVAGLVALLGIARIITKPVAQLVGQVEAYDPDQPIRLPQTFIMEIDELTSALEGLSVRAVRAASRLTSIIKMVGLPIGGFEEDEQRGRVFLTETLIEILRIDSPRGGYMPLDKWKEMLTSITGMPEDGFANVYRLVDEHKEASFRWLRIETRKEDEGAIGVVSDVTDDVLEKRRLEYERDYDSLTKLPNRRFFRERAMELLQDHADKTGALLFVDMDNLKFINDTYGHDTGDLYLCRMATALEEFFSYGGLVSRLSGDEFVALLCGFDTEDEIREIIQSITEKSHDMHILAPDGSMQRLRFSTGVTWYPRDTTSLDMMLRYADFAMYEIKQSNKGFIGEFDEVAYQSKSFLTDKQGLFDTMLEEKEIAFALQPVVDAKTGDIFAYEALLRPMTPGLRSPLEVLQLASRVSKLYQMERLIVFSVFQWLRGHVDLLKGRMLLFNTIASHCLNNADASELKDTYGDLICHTIMEITESEQSSPEILDQKISFVRDLDGQIAIDDYGSGYSNELNILLTEPNIIKIDMTIIRNIHLDENRRQIVRNTISYAHPRGIGIVAEGVENVEELKTLIDLGVDYLQGYYIARPQFSVDEIADEIRLEIRRLSGIDEGDEETAKAAGSQLS